MLKAHHTKLLNCKHRSIRIIFEGSGDPGDMHEIVGVQFLDGDDNVLQTVGESKFDELDSYVSTI
jgi:hypothetical protein